MTWSCEIPCEVTVTFYTTITIEVEADSETEAREMVENEDLKQQVYYNHAYVDAKDIDDIDYDIDDVEITREFSEDENQLKLL